MKRLSGVCIGIIAVMLGAWLAGFDFDERGKVAFTIYMVAVLFGGLGYLIGDSLEGWK